jgi:hypothetical protein
MEHERGAGQDLAQRMAPRRGDRKAAAGELMTWRDPTTAAIEEANAERDKLRTEVMTLVRAMQEIHERGYTHAVREIRNHFASVGQPGVVAEIDKIFGKVRFP